MGPRAMIRADTFVAADVGEFDVCYGVAGWAG